MIQGTNGNDTLNGNSGNYVMHGQAGSNTYYIDTNGNDVMHGQDRNDTYYVNSSGGSVIEEVNQGTDTVYNGLNTSAVSIESDNNSWTIQINGTTDSITIHHQTSGADASIDSFAFGNSVFSNTQLNGMLG